jgi:hypothetical protein
MAIMCIFFQIIRKNLHTMGDYLQEARIHTCDIVTRISVNEQKYAMQRQFLSPQYTTRWADIPKIIC